MSGFPASAAVAGWAQVVNRDDDRIVHPMVLLEEAGRSALAAAGVAADQVQAILSTPLTALVEQDHTETLAARLGARRGPRVVSAYSGAAPQRLLARACALVAAGEVEVALVVGGIADASVRRARRRGVEPPALPTSTWSQGSDRPSDLPQRKWDGAHFAEIAAGAGSPPGYFALVQSALDRGMSDAARASRLGALMAPFTEVAAARAAHAWFPRARDASQIATATPANRMVAEPYTKLMCSFPTVDMAAALVVTPAARAGRRGVFPVAITTAEEVGPPSRWPSLDRPPALSAAVEEALRLSDTDLAEVDALDLYSCFPAAVLMGCQALGLDPIGDRLLTATGGLPYFGGPGASYGLHALVCLFDDLHHGRADTVLSLGLGGFVTDFSVGVYSREERRGALVDLPRPEAPGWPVVEVAEGPAEVEAMTVLHARGEGPVAAPVIARLPSGERVGARCADPALAGELSGQNLVGREVELTGRPGRLEYRLR